MVIFSSQYTLCQYNEAAALSSVMQQSTHKKMLTHNIIQYTS